MTEQQGEQTIKQLKTLADQAARVETEPAPALARRCRAVLFQTALVLAAGAFAVLTFLVKTVPSFAIDLQISQSLQQVNFPPLAVLMQLVSWPGFFPQAAVISALIILLLYRSGLRWEAAAALIAAILSTAVNLLVKELIQRPRPTPDLVDVFSTLNSASFPSGHVMLYLDLFGFVGFLAYSLLKPGLRRSLTLGLCGGLTALVGVSRIYLGDHWASDVLGAYLLGSLLLAGFIQLYLWGKPRFFVPQRE